uniref:Uncharacterized protein n=1 Tax=Sipha flava TaxID=143950 RepID=A0A2S2Q1I0_9HEMI
MYRAAGRGIALGEDNNVTCCCCTQSVYGQRKYARRPCRGMENVQMTVVVVVGGGRDGTARCCACIISPSPRSGLCVRCNNVKALRAHITCTMRRATDYILKVVLVGIVNGRPRRRPTDSLPLR